MASHNIHAGPKGLSFKLGMGPGSGPILLAGPSNTGFADPADGASFSLTQITTALLLKRPDLDALVACRVLLALQNALANEFLRTQARLEKQKATTMYA